MNELVLTLGGVERRLPVHNLNQSDEWQQKLAQAIARVELPDTTDGADLVAAFIGLPSALLLDAVIAYDLTDAIGGRDWIRDHATERDIYVAFQAMAGETFPYLADARTVVGDRGPTMLAGVLERFMAPRPAPRPPVALPDAPRRIRRAAR